MEKMDREFVEKLAGIEFYGTNQKGIGGIIKKHYKDFIVREITREGKILEMKDDRKDAVFLTKHKYTTFNVTKVERDTLDVVEILARKLNIPYNQIFYSGLKDHRAITVQKMSIKRNVIDKLKNLRIKNVFIRDIQSTKYPVKLGDNWGNNFSIVIRNVIDFQQLPIRLEKIKKDLDKNGFPNYYGLQRFGVNRPNSHLIGKYIMQKKYKEVIEEFLMRIYSTNNNETIKVRKSISEILSYINSFENFPKNFQFEKKIVDYLKEYDEDYKGCILTFSKDLISLLISAYQSYLFNKALSERIRLGYSINTPEKGDLIGILVDEMAGLTKIKYLFNGDFKKPLKKALKINKAAIISPILGHDTDLNPSYLMSKIYLDIMKEEGITQKIFETQEFTDVDFHGTYRPINVKPRGLKIINIKDDEFFPGAKQIRLNFDLRKGSYATILLREFLKQ